jgi:molecular chaperone GrpE
MNTTNGRDNEQTSGNGPADTPQAASPLADDTGAALEADLKKLQDERDSLFEQVARVQADFRNAQKRLLAEKQQDVQFANAKLVRAIIPVLDSFERALETSAAKADPGVLLKGMSIVHDQLVKVLQDHNVEIIEPSPGTPFDANLHEALMQEPDDRYKEPAVTQLLQKGYSMHGRLLRPAQVAVSKTS